MVAKQRAVSQRNAARRENQRILEAAQEANGTRIRPTPQTQGARVRAHRRRRRRRRQSTWMTWLPVGIAILILLAVIIPIFLSMRHKKIDADTAGNQAKAEETTVSIDKEGLLQKAGLLAAQYNYGKAIKVLDQVIATEPDNEELLAMKVKYTRKKSQLVEYTGEIYHVFFHQLMVDTERIFSEENQADWAANNSVMTGLDEFNKILPQLYENGYVLVNFDQIYSVKTDKKGNTTLKKKKLMLPKGKKPLILSQDDVNFYQKTTIQWGGYGQKFVLDENGDVKVLYIDKDGNELVGDYDLVPALDTFLDEHPDFSYRGAKGYVGLTGYDGVLGYRVNSDQKDSPTYAEDVKTVTAIADAMKADGWKFASHSYSHGQMSYQTAEEIDEDATWWEEQVANIVGETNVYLFPYGDWGQYNETTATEKMDVLKQHGFVFMNGVGAYTYNREYSDYLFMDRCNLDGQCMYNRAELLSQYFDVKKVWDENRPEEGLAY